MTNIINLAAQREARRATGPQQEPTPTAQQVAAELRASLQRQIAAGAKAEPITTWQQVADSVDEATWQRILGDLSPETRAECERIRPPASLLREAEKHDDHDARRREALNRLKRATTNNPLIRRQPKETK